MAQGAADAANPQAGKSSVFAAAGVGRAAMESITSVGMTQSEHYYTHDNYGLAADIVSNSQWSGKGAAKLGLSGPIRVADFKQLLHAVALDGRALHRRGRTSGRARAGVDLTFNPPKSVSQRALVGGDTRLVQAHQTAVATTLSILERCCAQTRIAHSGQRCKMATGNLTIGQFLHDLSRAKDPHLHSH
ncbi:MAG TPA: MobF family relaxase, partial [Allocoleopsis sp.]